MKTPWLVVTVAVAVFGYVGSASSHGPKIVDADDAAVASCTFLQVVDGRSVFGERLKTQGIAKAKEDARNEAAKLGATHIVWDKAMSTDVTTISGKAYHCGH